MTKGEYCRLKNIHTSSPNFNPKEELDEEFKKLVDDLTDNFMDIYEENEEDCDI